MKKAALAFIAPMLLSACAPYATNRVIPPPPHLEPTAPLDIGAIKAALQPGHAIIKGQAFAKTVGGDVKYGAGNTITILPKTDYVSQCIGIVGIPYMTSDCMKAIGPLARKVTADGEGRFEVDDVAPGEYQLSTLITWGVPGPYGISQTGGIVNGVVTVSSDTDIVSVNLTSQ